jgi:uncharacterized protein
MNLSVHIAGVGLGLRQEFSKELESLEEKPVDFIEIAPENWMKIGGWRHQHLKAIAARYSMIAHGLCLSIGGSSPLNIPFIHELKNFFSEFNIAYYSEHLSYCSDEYGYLYDLLPIPFTEEAVMYVANRIKIVQDILQRRIAMENVSYYCAPGQELSELEFVNAVIREADCDLLLDVNNVYVNSINHGFCPYHFLNGLDYARLVYIHIAGHHKESDDLLIDTHGEEVVLKVWDLLTHVYRTQGSIPTLLERDNNIPPLEQLLDETKRIKSHQQAYAKKGESCYLS